MQKPQEGAGKEKNPKRIQSHGTTLTESAASKHNQGDVISTETRSRQEKRWRSRCTIQITIKIPLYIPQIDLSCILLRGYKDCVCVCACWKVVPSLQLHIKKSGEKEIFQCVKLFFLEEIMGKEVKESLLFQNLKRLIKLHLGHRLPTPSTSPPSLEAHHHPRPQMSQSRWSPWHPSCWLPENTRRWNPPRPNGSRQPVPLYELSADLSDACAKWVKSIANKQFKLHKDANPLWLQGLP